jgi:hypothetical protein
MPCICAGVDLGVASVQSAPDRALPEADGKMGADHPSAVAIGERRRHRSTRAAGFPPSTQFIKGSRWG